MQSHSKPTNSHRYPRDCQRNYLPAAALIILFSTLILSSRTILAASPKRPQLPFASGTQSRAFSASGTATIALNIQHLSTTRGGANSKSSTRMTSDDTAVADDQVLQANNYTADMTHENPDQVIGGGAINEKKRTFLDRGEGSKQTKLDSGSTTAFQGTRNQAHFLQAMEGLDRYPNYLAKWNNEEAEELEQALLQRLEKVREQRRYTGSQHERLQQVVEKVCREEPTWREFLQPPQSWDEVRTSGILDDRISNTIFRSKFFRESKNHTVPSVQEVLSGSGQRVELEAGYLEEVMDEEVSDVYSFPLLSEAFCVRLQAYMQIIMDEIDKSKDPDFMAGGQRRVRNLDNLGLSWLNDLLFHLVVRPISRHLYQEMEMGGDSENDTGDLDWRHAFLAAYSADPNQHKPRQRLVPHTDDAEVTLNVCVGDVFEGGDLQFWGLRGTQTAGTLMGEYTPKRGRALLHAGRQLHEVTDVTAGDRFALIMWTRSWSGIRSTTCPCCWLNRRSDGGQTTSCICSARWN